MLQLREMLENGSSIGTCEAVLHLSPGILKKWLDKGQTQPKTPYRILFTKVRAWIAVARGAAEANQLVKAPSQWLERSTSSKLLNTDETPTTPDISTALITHNNAPAQLQLGAQAALAAVKALARSGVDLNEAFAKDLVHIDPPKDT